MECIVCDDGGVLDRCEMSVICTCEMAAVADNVVRFLGAQCEQQHWVTMNKVCERYPRWEYSARCTIWMVNESLVKEDERIENRGGFDTWSEAWTGTPDCI